MKDFRYLSFHPKLHSHRKLLNCNLFIVIHGFSKGNGPNKYLSLTYSSFPFLCLLLWSQYHYRIKICILQNVNMLYIHILYIHFFFRSVLFMNIQLSENEFVTQSMINLEVGTPLNCFRDVQSPFLRGMCIQYEICQSSKYPFF